MDGEALPVEAVTVDKRAAVDPAPHNLRVEPEDLVAWLVADEAGSKAEAEEEDQG